MASVSGIFQRLKMFGESIPGIGGLRGVEPVDRIR